MAFKILEGKVRDFPEAAARIVLAGLDPTTLITNAEAHALYDDGALVAFCAIKDHGRIKELGNVYTVPRFRGKGHASRLLQHVIGKHKTLHLFCRHRLIPFYEKLGFRTLPAIPAEFGMRRTYMRALAALGIPHAAMRR